MLEIIMITLLSSCIHSETFQTNLNYLKSLQSEEVFSDTNGTYYKTIEPNGECSIDFEPDWTWDSYSNFGNSFEQREINRRINWLTERYCPQE